MTATLFVDTNVLVYARDASERAKQSIAAELLMRLWREQSGRTSVQVLSEYFVTMTRKLSPRTSPAAAWAEVEALLVWDPQPVNPALVRRAYDVQRRHRLGWWDSMIVAAAQLQNCGILLSEDMHDGGNFDGVIVRNPFTSTLNEPLPQYATSSVTSRHRPRGRPRKAAPLSG